MVRGFGSPARVAATVALAAAAVLVSGASPAAAGSGGLTISPVQGGDDTPLQVTTSGPCPRPATNILGRIYGAGFDAAGTNVIGNTATGVSNTGPFFEPLSLTLRSAALRHNPPVTLHGVYTLVIICRKPLIPAAYADYRASIKFTTPHSYGPTGAQAAVPPLPQASALPPGASPPATSAPVSTASGASTRSAASPSPSPASAPTPGGSNTGLVVSLVAIAVALLGGATAAVARLRRRPPNGTSGPTRAGSAAEQSTRRPPQRSSRP